MKLYEGEELPDSELSFLEVPAFASNKRNPTSSCIVGIKKIDGKDLKLKESFGWMYAVKPGNHIFTYIINASNRGGEVAPSVIARRYEVATHKSGFRGNVIDASLSMKKGAHYYAEPICDSGDLRVKFVME